MFVQGEGNQHPARNGKELLLPGFVLCQCGGTALLIPEDRGREDLALWIPKAHPCA